MKCSRSVKPHCARGFKRHDGEREILECSEATFGRYHLCVEYTSRREDFYKIDIVN